MSHFLSPLTILLSKKSSLLANHRALHSQHYILSTSASANSSTPGIVAPLRNLPWVIKPLKNRQGWWRIYANPHKKRFGKLELDIVSENNHSHALIVLSQFKN